MEMIELFNWIGQQLRAINIQTALTISVLVILGGTWLFKLIASHDRRALEAEKAAHKTTESEKQELANELHRKHDIETELLARLEQQQKQLKALYDWQQVELSDEEKTVLLAISQDKLDQLHTSNLSKQRISLAKDVLLEYGFIGYGTEGPYTLTKGLKWLDHNGILD